MVFLMFQLVIWKRGTYLLKEKHHLIVNMKLVSVVKLICNEGVKTGLILFINLAFIHKGCCNKPLESYGTFPNITESCPLRRNLNIEL